MCDGDHDAGRQHLMRKLKSLATLSAADEAAIGGLDMTIEHHPARHTLLGDGDTPSFCHLILDGFACRHKSLADGTRQILSFHTPGDILDLQSLYLETMDYGVSTVTPTTVGRMERSVLQHLARTHLGIAQAFWRDTLVDASIYREWMLGLGRRSARTHLAHLVCEVAERFRIVSADTSGGAGAGTRVMPLTRTDLADALGVTVVEVNRELNGLREDGMLEPGASTLTVLDLDGLAAVCDFNPEYLHQGRAA